MMRKKEEKKEQDSPRTKTFTAGAKKSFVVKQMRQLLVLKRP
jgi:hypothetical protein